MKNEELKNTISRKQVNLLLLAIAVLGICPAAISSAGSSTIYTDVFTKFLIYIVAVVGGGTWLTRRYGGNEQKLIAERNSELSRIAANHNEQVNMLVQLFEEESANGGVTSLEALRQRVLEGRSTTSTRHKLSNRELNKVYSKRYDKYHTAYKNEQASFINSWNQQNKERLVFRRFWGWVIVIGFIAAFVNYAYTAVVDAANTPVATSLASETETIYWNAKNIPIPYLQDSTQYVSNPDHVLTQETVDKVNVTMKRIEQEFDVQSVVIVVNHIENDDPFRFAQEVGNSYGVGRHDRGLVVVVGYEDHSINISPGRSLEADLTDAECHRLEQQYVVPAMRAELPDSAMIYLTEALYAKLQSKELPQMTLLSNSDSAGNDVMGLGLYTCFMLVWLIFFVYKNKTYQWLGLPAAAHLMANPFYVPETGGGVFIGGGGGGHGGFGGGFGGGHGGGSFGGGSFGGGGATSRW
jgi:uncharacterized membrane protein YgcG